MDNWLQQSNSAILPGRIIDSDEARKKHKELLTQLHGIESLSNPFLATEPQCGRTIIMFGGDSAAGLLTMRDPQTYIGLVDLDKKALIYAMAHSESYEGRPSKFSDKLFYFCSPNNEADFAFEIAAKIGAIEIIR
jgi:hypothetical protein